MKNKFPVLSIVGTTAVGKTEFAFSLADALIASKKFAGVDLISADSRQIYQGIEILSGADIPEGFVEQKDLTVSAFRFFQKGGVRLFGVSCLIPDQEWSVAQFQDFAQSLIRQAQKSNRAVLIVGGTGLYHDQLFTTDPSLHVPRNEEFRVLAESLTVGELQQLLNELDKEKLESMNNSDRQNPRRLVRAIEIAGYHGEKSCKDTPQLDTSHHYIGLSTPFEQLLPKIRTRIERRLTVGVVREIEVLQEKFGNTLSKQVTSTLGYEHIDKVIRKSLSLEEATSLWLVAEKQYAQRQLTWWKATDAVVWFDRTADSEWQLRALEHATSLFCA